MSLQTDCETVEIAMLIAQTGLSGISIQPFDTDAVVGNEGVDRIEVKAQTPEAERFGRNQSEVKIWKVPVLVTAILVERNASKFDTMVAGIEAANLRPFESAGEAVADSTFPSGWNIEQSQTGTRDNEPNTRIYERTFDFLIPA